MNFLSAHQSSSPITPARQSVSRMCRNAIRPGRGEGWACSSFVVRKSLYFSARGYGREVHVAHQAKGLTHDEARRTASIRRPSSPMCSPNSSISGRPHASMNSCRGSGPPSIPPIEKQRETQADRKPGGEVNQIEACGQKTAYDCSASALRSSRRPSPPFSNIGLGW
jgi:hypothetical protein